jgi:hypothetical protein
MTQQQIILDALREIAIAESMVDQAKQKYYNARKKLEGLYSPVSPKRAPKLSKATVAKILLKRKRNQVKNAI